MISEALSFVSPSDRDTWVKMAMAVKDELGDEGFDIWDTWSQQDDSYKSADAKAVWRSIHRGGGIGVGTLFAEAKQLGWNGGGQQPPISPRIQKNENEQLVKRRALARLNAEIMLAQAELSWHPYLARKGFPKQEGFVLDGLLLIPMRDLKGRLNSIQTIASDGTKKFLPGGQARGSVFAIGTGAESFYCEGYATGLSVRSALSSLYRQARVVVCFSAGNLAHVAKCGFVIADHDENRTGQRYAEKTGLPWWMPPEIGDANDYHQTHGVRALADAINGLRRAIR